MNASVRKVFSDLSGIMCKAADEALRIQREGITSKAKGVLDVVTDVDTSVEQMLGEWVAKHFSNDGIVAEEGTTRLSQSGYEWYIDPIDGTKNFASGLPFFGISAGRAKEGRGVLGWLEIPRERRYIFAISGEGVWRTSSRETSYPELFVRNDFSRPFKDSVIALGLTPGNEHLLTAFNKKCWTAVALGSFVYEA